ncbi:MAG TPA: ATP synthase F1 subunit delta [Acidobacteriaceae bacterium]|nr:ATP synthase F1 subunit delta [Acidobacteriaceae bacterium]
MPAAFAARYARALADVIFSPDASAHLKPERAHSQLNDFAAAWRESADMREFLLDPSFPAARKVAFLDKLNTRLGMSQPIRNFIAVLINHDRLSGFEEILSAFHSEMNARLNIAEVEVTSARELDQDERAAIEAQAARLTGSAIHARFRDDASLMGGIILKIGSTVYDDSVRGRLDRLREQLATS